MYFLRNLILFTAKILIGIGDGVLVVFAIPYKLCAYSVKVLRVGKKTLRKRKAQTVFKDSIFAKKPKFNLSRKIKKAIGFPGKSAKSAIFRFKVKRELLRKGLSRVSLSKPRFLRRREKIKKGKLFPLPIYIKAKYFILGFLFSAILVFAPLLFVISLQNLPHPNQLISQEVAQTTKIYDRNGVLLYQIYANQNRTLVPLSEIPEALKKATIAIEDKNFYSTPGFDLGAIFRSAVSNAKGEPLQGGSTITQQLIKSRLLSPESTINRKLKEVILAVWAERIYSKDQILEMYLNQVPYGGTAWGVEAASQTYFGKNVKDLSLAESAFLAGLPRAPSIYSPYGEYKDLWKKRQSEVLNNMAELDFITEAERNAAMKEELVFNPQQNILHAPHFVMYVKELLIRRYGIEMVERGGLEVSTSLDLKTQDMAQAIVTDEVEKNAHLNLTNAASLITNPKTGDILAMVGSKDYYSDSGGNYNVTTALRQPGSTIKVITYSAALLNGFTPATTIADSPVTYPSTGGRPYAPVNYGGNFHGVVTLRLALANSINIPAVKILNKIGIAEMVGLAKKMGISSWKGPENYGLSITLGSAEVKMTEIAIVYGTLANKGQKVELNPILRITNYKDEVLEEKKEIRRSRVLPEGIAFIISSILSDNPSRAMEFGTNSPLVIPGKTVSVKTGTTDNKRDNWTIGYTPSLLTAVWVGNNDNSPMDPSLTSGITGAAPIWNRIMMGLLKDTPDERFSALADIAQKTCFGRIEYFIKGTEGSVACRPLSLSPASPTPNP